MGLYEAVEKGIALGERCADAFADSVGQDDICGAARRAEGFAEQWCAGEAEGEPFHAQTLSQCVKTAARRISEKLGEQGCGR